MLSLPATAQVVDLKFSGTSNLGAGILRSSDDSTDYVQGSSYTDSFSGSIHFDLSGLNPNEFPANNYTYYVPVDVASFTFSSDGINPWDSAPFEAASVSFSSPPDGMGGYLFLYASRDGGNQSILLPIIADVRALGAEAGTPYPTISNVQLAQLNVTSVLDPRIGSAAVSSGIGLSLSGATVSAAPEPATWALMILGFGAAGVAMRRSRKKVSAAYA